MPSTCEADEGGLRYGREPSAGRPVSGPYAKNAPASLFAVGAAPCGRPHLIRHGLWPCHLPLKGKARVRITPPPQQRRSQQGECPAFDYCPASGSERRGAMCRLSHPRLCDDCQGRLIGGPPCNYPRSAHRIRETPRRKPCVKLIWFAVSSREKRTGESSGVPSSARARAIFF